VNKKKKKILIANGVNLDLLGSREPDIYGRATLKDLEKQLRRFSKKFHSISLEFFQTNDEAKFLQKLSQPYSGIILNSGAWTHTSLAIADRLRAVKTPFVEVHISDTSSREDFRKHSFTAAHALKVIKGKGFAGYEMALGILVNSLTPKS